MSLSLQILKKQDWTEFSCRNNVYNAKFNVKTRLVHCVAIEDTSSNDYNCLDTIVTSSAYKAFQAACSKKA